MDVHGHGHSVGSLKRLVLDTLMITPSGALSPGPLSAIAVVSGLSLGPLGGLLIALGHTIVELPYVLLLVKTMERARIFLERYKVLFNTGVVVFLLYFSYLLARDSLTLLKGEASMGGAVEPRSLGALDALVAGMMLTGLNVYFLLWWLTVGYPLIRGAAENGAKGLGVMYVSHVWMDYAWLALLAAGGGAAGLLGPRFYGGLLGVLALILLWFAVRIALDMFRSRVPPGEKPGASHQ